MVRLYVLLLLCLSGLTAYGQKEAIVAKTKTSTSPQTYAGRIIVVTSGGGFMGRSASYCLQDDGRLYGKRSTDAAYKLLGKQTTANTKRVFWSLEERCQIKKTKFDNPGNTYKSVTWQKGKERYNVTWGSPQDSVPANYNRFYSSFMAMIPARMRMK